MTALLLLLVLAVLPRLEAQADSFLVLFRPGAAAACTVYTSTSETMERDGKVVPYSPSHCWLLDEDATAYDDDWAYIEPAGTAWLVQAHLYYPVAGQDAREELSNTVRVIR